MNETQELFSASAHSRDKPPGKIGGCVGTFLQLFDWNPRKRLFSTKRLPAERPNGRKATATKKKYKDERMPVAKLLLLAEEENRGGFPSPKKLSSVSSVDRVCSEDGMMGKRVPGVVARLMGLESLPDEPGSDSKLSPQHPKALPAVEVRPLQELLHVRQEPALLSDLLLEREYLEAKKVSLKDRLQVPVPVFVKNLPDPVAQMNYIPPKDGFKKPSRAEPHLQPYADQKYRKSLRPLKKTSRDLADTKHLILALSPRASSDSLRPILLPSKVHNKLMSSPIKSPTKMGSRSARLLEAAVKILEPSLQSSTARSRTPPVRPSSATSREFKDPDGEAGMVEERREKLAMVEKKVGLNSNAARALKGQSMSRSWNGREETGRYGHELKNGSSLHDSGRKRNEHAHGSQSRAASPLRTSHRSRSRGVVPHEDISMKVMEEIKTVVPQGFEEAYGGGLKPLNLGRREEMRLDKYEIEDRRVSEKHVVSSLSNLSSLSVGNSPYSICSERSTTSSLHDPLRRSGSAKEGPAPPTPNASKTRFMRSKSVKEEKSSKLSNGGGGGQVSHHTRALNRDVRVRQEIPQQAHQTQQAHQVHRIHEGTLPVPVAVITECPLRVEVDTKSAERDFSKESASDDPESAEVAKRREADAGKKEAEVPTMQLPRASTLEVEIPVDEPVSPKSSGVPTVVQVSPAYKDSQAPARTNSGGGLLSYSRLFGARKAGDRKSDNKEKNKGRTEGPKKSESSLVRSLLRRKTPAHHAPASAAAPAPIQSMDKPKKRGGKKRPSAEPSSREASDAETPGYLSEDYSMDMDCDIAAVIQANIYANNEACKERALHPESDLSKDSPSKCVDDVFPEVPLDKGCLRLLDDYDETGSKRRMIEGFDCVPLDDGQEKNRGDIASYAAYLMDDLKLEEMFSTGTVMQGSGRNGFSYSPLVELEEPPVCSLESFILEGGAEVEKCVSFLGSTGVSSPDSGFTKSELLGEEVVGQDMPSIDQRSRTLVNLSDELSTPAAEDANALVVNELSSEVLKIVENSLEEGTERVVKKFAPEGRVLLANVDGDEAVCASIANDDCGGQPSPVSVLDCLFEEDETRSSPGNLHDSLCDMEDEESDGDDEDDSLIDDLLYKSARTLGQRNQQKPRRKVPSPAAPDTEAIVQTQSETSVLEDSRARCTDPLKYGAVVEKELSFEEEEEEYMRKILSVWELFPEASGNAAGADLPITSTLFDRLESQGRASAWKREKEREQYGSPPPESGPPARSFKQWQSLWLHRRLLFDCVNEILAYTIKFKYPDPWMGIPALRQQPKGRALVKEVYSEIKDWRQVNTEELDTIIELDMGRGFGNWLNVTHEIAEIGLEIERSILRGMIEDLVAEIMGVTSVVNGRPVRV